MSYAVCNVYRDMHHSAPFCAIKYDTTRPPSCQVFFGGVARSPEVMPTPNDVIINNIFGPNSASPQFPPPKLNYLAATSRQVFRGQMARSNSAPVIEYCSGQPRGKMGRDWMKFVTKEHEYKLNSFGASSNYRNLDV